MSSMVYRWNKGGSGKLWKFWVYVTNGSDTILSLQTYLLCNFASLLHMYVHVLCVYIYIYSGTQYALLKWWYSEWTHDLNVKDSQSFNKRVECQLRACITLAFGLEQKRKQKRYLLLWNLHSCEGRKSCSRFKQLNRIISNNMNALDIIKLDTVVRILPPYQ